jgi:small subunit ribosomal protein S8e
MALSHQKARRKPTGARYIAHSKKFRYYLGSDPTFTKLEPLRKIVMRTRGANEKIRLLSVDKANVLDPKTKSHKVVAIKTVVDNSANKNFIRRNIITSGAVINTELGKARVTSRPGQTGVVNAVLIAQ